MHRCSGLLLRARKSALIQCVVLLVLTSIAVPAAAADMEFEVTGTGTATCHGGACVFTIACAAVAGLYRGNPPVAVEIARCWSDELGMEAPASASPGPSAFTTETALRPFGSPPSAASVCYDAVAEYLTSHDPYYYPVSGCSNVPNPVEPGATVWTGESSACGSAEDHCVTATGALLAVITAGKQPGPSAAVFACGVAAPRAIGTRVTRCSVNEDHGTPAAYPGPLAGAGGGSITSGDGTYFVCWSGEALFATGEVVAAGDCKSVVVRPIVPD